MVTTYVLGAGASRHAGYPLACEMGKGLLEEMLKSTDGQGQAYAEYLIDNFGMSANIEDLITELQIRIDALKSSEATQDKIEYRRLGTRLGYLSTALRAWFYKIRTGTAHAYAQFAESIVKPGDVVISFNYDDSLERELKRTRKWDISQGYGFQFGSVTNSSDVLMLKLHGSINWLVSLFGGAKPGSVFAVPNNSSLGDRPVIHRADLEYLGYQEFSGYTYQSGGAFPCMILPGRTKRFVYETSFGQEFDAFWAFIWSQAARALNQTDRIVICGYSLLPVDQRACELLLKEPNKDTPVSVVSGSQSERIAADFKRSGFRNVTVSSTGHFEEWCAAQLQKRIRSETLNSPRAS